MQEKDKRTIGNKEAFVFMRSDVFSLDGATTVRVEKNYVDDLDSYLFGSNVLDDGTIIGDPVKDCRLVPSGTHGLHGGRFGCTRTWGSTCNDNKEYYSYLTTRGPGIGLGTTFHSGVDIYAANGTPLYSILQGTVVDIHNIDDNDLGKSITIKSTTNIGVVYLMYCHLSEIEVKVGDEVEIFPMPAFYFNWMNQEYNRIQRNQAINVTIYALSFTLGVGEIAAAKKAWDIAVGLTGLVHSSGGLYFKINDDVVKRLEKTDNGLRFIIAWDAIGYVLTGLEMRSELLKVRLPYFSAVVHAWEHLSHEEKLVLKEMMGEDEYDQLIAIINTSK